MTLQEERPAPVLEAPPLSLEDALREEEARVDALLKAASKLVSALKAWKKGAQVGNVGQRQKAAELACQLAPALAPAVLEQAAQWSFDATAWLQSDAWLDEVQQAATRAGVRTLREGDTLIAPPVVVRAVPTRSAVKVGKDVRPTLRPAAIAEELKKLRDRKSTAGAAEFLECLHGVWKKTRSADAPVARFRDIYAHFCLTPGWKRDNPEQAFGQAIYALQQSGLRMTRKEVPFQIEWPSGNVKDRDVFTVWAADGKPLRYYGIRFLEADR